MVQQFSCISSTFCSLKLSKTLLASRKNNTFLYLLWPLKILYQRIVRRQNGKVGVAFAAVGGAYCRSSTLNSYVWTVLARMKPRHLERKTNCLCSFGWWNSLGDHRFQSFSLICDLYLPSNKLSLLPICSLLELFDLVIKLYVKINRLVTVQRV